MLATTASSAGFVYQILSRKVCCLGIFSTPSLLARAPYAAWLCPNSKWWLGCACFASLVALDTARQNGTRRSWTRHIVDGFVWCFPFYFLALMVVRVGLAPVSPPLQCGQSLYSKRHDRLEAARHSYHESMIWIVLGLM